MLSSVLKSAVFILMKVRFISAFLYCCASSVHNIKDGEWRPLVVRGTHCTLFTFYTE